MNLEKILKEKNIIYKKIDYSDNVFIYKTINEERTIVCIIERSRDFIIDRDLFYYLDNNKEKYSFILENISKNKMYYLDFKSKNNWLKNSFDRTDKEELFFGKIVLNNEIKESDFKNII